MSYIFHTKNILFTVLLLALLLAPAAMAHSASEYVVTKGPSIEDPSQLVAPMLGIFLSKTVGTDPNSCAKTSTISVSAGTVVYYCYTLKNTGNTRLPLHTLEDDLLGSIFTDLAYALEPGTTYSFIDATLTRATINTDTVSTGTWHAKDGHGSWVWAYADTTVTVNDSSPPAEVLPEASNTALTPSPASLSTKESRVGGVRAESLRLHVSASQESINVDWNLAGALAGDFDGYELLRSVNGSDYKAIRSMAGNQHTDKDSSLTEGAEYCYQVQAVSSRNSIIGQSNAVCAQFGSVTLWVPDQVVQPDATNVPVTINVANGNGLCVRALDIKVSYDPTIVQATGAISPTIYTEGYDFVANTTVPGEIKISSFSSSGQCQALHGAGSLFDLFFNVIGNQAEVSPLNFIEGLAATAIYDADDLFQPVSVALQNGSLTVEAGFARGDVNGDEQVDEADALLALDIASYLIDPTAQQEAACDVNGDGLCNTADSSLISCYPTTQNWAECGAVNPLSHLTEPAADESTSVRVSTTLNPIQQRLTVQVELNDGTEFAGGEFAFAYDAEQMSPRSVSLTELTHQFNIESNQDIPGIFFVSLASNEGSSGICVVLCAP